MKNDKGETITSRKGIANVFGEFYSRLYVEDQLGEEVQDPHKSETRMNIGRESRIDEVKNEIPEFTQDEVQTAIDGLKKKGKASGSDGIRAEETSRHATKRRKRSQDRP